MNNFNTKRDLVRVTLYLTFLFLLTMSIVTKPDETEAEIKTIRMATDLGVHRNDGTGDSKAIQKALNIAKLEGFDLMFPQGTYELDHDVIIPSGVSLYGQGIVYFDATKSKDMRYLKSEINREINRTRFEGFISRNVGIELRGKTDDNMAIRDNIFLNGAPETDYVLVTHGSYEIERNILIREQGDSGRGIVTYKTHDSKVRHNHIGKLEHKNLLIDVPGMSKLYARVDSLLRSNVLSTTHESDFITGINVLNGDKHLIISENIVHGESSTHTRTRDGKVLKRDHALYAKGYDNLHIESNYFVGWAKDPTGGVKIRNGDHAKIIANTFNDVGLLLYVYSDYPNPMDWRLTNTLVAYNLYIGGKNAGNWGTGFSYTQDFYNGKMKKSIISGNLFIYNTFRGQPGDRILLDNRRLDGIKKEAFALYANHLEDGNTIPGGQTNVADHQQRLLAHALDPKASQKKRLDE